MSACDTLGGLPKQSRPREKGGNREEQDPDTTTHRIITDSHVGNSTYVHTYIHRDSTIRNHITWASEPNGWIEKGTAGDRGG
jgi:hypothetical protein